MKITSGYVASEFDALYAIECECFDQERFSPRRMKRYLKTNEVLVARVGGVPVGTLLLKVNKGFSYVSNVSVLKEYRGQGIATALMKQAEKLGRGDIRLIRLHVRFDNPAQKLYFDLGYRVVKVLEEFYAGSDTALLMEKVL